MSAKKRIKPGDLAFVITAGNHPSNLGKIVRIIRRATQDIDYCDDYTGVVWMAQSEGGSLFSTLKDGTIDKSLERPFQDRHLLLIQPDGKADSTSAKRRKEVAA